MKSSSKHKSRNHHTGGPLHATDNSLKDQFSSLTIQTEPISNIPSLPVPRIKSPIREQQIHQSLSNDSISGGLYKSNFSNGSSISVNSNNKQRSIRHQYSNQHLKSVSNSASNSSSPTPLRTPDNPVFVLDSTSSVSPSKSNNIYNNIGTPSPRSYSPIKNGVDTTHRYQSRSVSNQTYPSNNLTQQSANPPRHVSNIEHSQKHSHYNYTSHQTNHQYSSDTLPSQNVSSTATSYSFQSNTPYLQRPNNQQREYSQSHMQSSTQQPQQQQRLRPVAPPINTQLASETTSSLGIYQPNSGFQPMPHLPQPSVMSPEHPFRSIPQPSARTDAKEELLPANIVGFKQKSASETPSYSNNATTSHNNNYNNGSYPESIKKSPSQTSIRKSPIVRQSLSFLKNARSFSTSSANQPDSPINNSGHSSSKEMEKYHLPLKQITTGGRVIPQRLDYVNQDMPKKSNSIATLTKRVASNSSLRSSADKFRYVSSSSLNTGMVQSSPSLRKRYIYPALLSEVAEAFLHEIKLSGHFKYGIEYRNSFSGSEAVDVLCRITKIRDRNLVLILGRSLDSQRLFHDVTYEHKLRDNKGEIYLINDEYLYAQTDNFRRQNSISSNMTNQTLDYYNVNSLSSSATLTNYNNEKQPLSENSISGVFVLLTQCYSPTCTRDKICYSISCPNRFEQRMRAELQNSGDLIRSDSHISFNQDEQKQYWQLTVPKSIIDTLDKREIKRQECIFETINSEKTFIKDLEYIKEFWIKPLSETKIIKNSERDQFIRNVFHNINEIWDVNHMFAEALNRRQHKSPIVETIADIFLDFIPQFTPFITYGAGQVIGKFEFDRQRRHNPLLRRFIEDTARREESKRLDLSSFLSKPTTRPARYPLLLKSIRDHTDPNSPDYEKLGSAIELLEKMLTKINFETGKQSDKMTLFQIKQKLLFKRGELVDLKLSADNRKFIYQCVLKKKGYQEKEKQGEIHVYLFDHYLLFIKLEYLNKKELFKVYQRPIPLPFLFYSLSEYAPSLRSIRKAAFQTGSAPALLGSNDTDTNGIIPLNSSVTKSPMTFKYIGSKGYELTLYGTPATQKMLSNKILAQTRKLLEDNDVYTLTPLSSNFFDIQNRINCAIPFDGGRKLLYGTNSGIYVSDRSSGDGSRLKIINKPNILQIEIIQEYQLLVALCEKKLYYWPTSVLNDKDHAKNTKLGKELINHISFFKIGVCDGGILLCAAKTNNVIRIFEPIDPIQQKKQKNKFVNNRQDVQFSSDLVSINFLKTKLCVGCSNGFQIVSLTHNTTESLLDPADTSLSFVTNKDKEGLRPLEIDRINNDFLLSYSSFAFFINHNGWRARPKWMIEWEGVPHKVALWYPYLLAFDTNFIEIRNVENAELLRVIVGENIRFLHASSQEILYAYEDGRGYDVVASLDFWDKSVKNRSRMNTVGEKDKPK